jgi:hypothetical protein
MCRILFSLFLFALLHTGAFAQTVLSIGGGYFGETITHPGALVEFEVENRISERASLPFRADLGFYYHPRNHTAVFLDFHYGFRRSFRSGWFVEESIGVGILQTILNGEEGVFEVDDNGTVSNASKFNAPDFMPSLTLGLGYNLTKHSDRRTLVWIRPKLFWQYPQRLLSVHHLALQMGMTVELGRGK